MNATAQANAASDRLSHGDFASTAQGLELLIAQHIHGAIEMRQIGCRGDCQDEIKLAEKYRDLLAAYAAHMRAAEEIFFTLAACDADADMAFAAECIRRGAWSELAR